MLALDEGRGVRETARLLKVSAAKVSEVRRMSATRQVCIPDRSTSCRTIDVSQKIFID